MWKVLLFLNPGTSCCIIAATRRYWENRCLTTRLVSRGCAIGPLNLDGGTEDEEYICSLTLRTTEKKSCICHAYAEHRCPSLFFLWDFNCLRWFVLTSSHYLEWIGYDAIIASITSTVKRNVARQSIPEFYSRTVQTRMWHCGCPSKADQKPNRSPSQMSLRVGLCAAVAVGE